MNDSQCFNQPPPPFFFSSTWKETLWRFSSGSRSLFWNLTNFSVFYSRRVFFNAQNKQKLVEKKNQKTWGFRGTIILLNTVWVRSSFCSWSYWSIKSVTLLKPVRKINTNVAAMLRHDNNTTFMASQCVTLHISAAATEIHPAPQGSATNHKCHVWATLTRMRFKGVNQLSRWVFFLLFFVFRGKPLEQTNDRSRLLKPPRRIGSKTSFLKRQTQMPKDWFAFFLLRANTHPTTVTLSFCFPSLPGTRRLPPSSPSSSPSVLAQWTRSPRTPRPRRPCRRHSWKDESTSGSQQLPRSSPS